jgi:hypothetical protein
VKAGTAAFFKEHQQHIKYGESSLATGNDDLSFKKTEAFNEVFRSSIPVSHPVGIGTKGKGF